MSMPWFKHYNNASTSLSIQKMMLDLDVVGYAYYFLLLELLCSKFDGFNCVIDLTTREVGVKLRIKSGRVQVILRSFSESNLLTWESHGVIIRINAPILLELKDKDFRRASRQRANDAPVASLRKRLKNKNKNNTIVNADVDYTHPLEIEPEEVNKNSFQQKANGLAEMWNDMAELNNLPKVKIPVSADRVKAMTPAMKEFTSIDDWYKIICTVTDNPFNLGDNDRKWKANFDWLFHKTKYNYRKLWEARNESSF